MARLGDDRRSVVRLPRWTALLVALLVLLGAAPAYADEGSIDHVDSRGGRLELLYSVPGAGARSPDLTSVKVSLDGTELDATARPASDARTAVRRTTVLAIDTSNSMAGAKFAAAKRAADVFLDSVPADLHVGIVTFAGRVRVLQEPSLDRAASHRLVRSLALSNGTRLYDGLLRAVRGSGTDGSRRVVVLSDGRDTSSTTLGTATKAVKGSGVKVDVVALAQSTRDQRLLASLAEVGDGAVISADDPAQLGAIFTREAQALASQVLVTAALPAKVPSEGSLEVSISVGDTPYTDSAFVPLSATHGTAEQGVAPAVGSRLQPPPASLPVGSRQLTAGFLALGVGLLVLVVGVLGGVGRRRESVASRIEPYTTRGAATQRRPVDQAPGVAAQAVNMAQKALQGNHGFETRLGAKLEAGGLTFKPAEWLLLHAGLAVGSTLLVFLVTGADVLLTAVALGAGVLVPWFYLRRKQSKRLKAFNSQLAATLQLLAGSLQAGLSIAQGMDTIVREGAEPVAGEFRRALVETRLGVQIEDALETVADRMRSDDFRWTVMAIRIQREVGGNLAELLLNVAATLRERDYLRRQVKSLSAEGRFSAYILLALPPGVLLYMSMVNRSYLHPLVATPVGWLLLVVMTGLMGVGAFMMNRMVKLEV